MSAFTDAELAYLGNQRLGRLATVGADGGPRVVPVSFRYDADSDTIHIGGHGIAGSKKFRDATRSPAVAFVVDDVASVDPWTVRGVEIVGTAETFTSGGGDRLGPGFDDAWIRIRPRRIIAWGIDTHFFHRPNSRAVSP